MLKSFLRYIQYEKVYSSHTVLSYHKDITQFEAFMADVNPAWQLTTVDSDDVRAWIVALMNGACAPSSVGRKLSALKSYFNFLVKQGILKTNPAAGIVTPKRPKPLPLFFKEQELDRQQFVEHLSDETPFEAVRNDLIIEMLYQTGMRRAELLALTDSDVDLERGVIRIFGKRQKERFVPIGEGLMHQVIHYIKVRSEEVVSLDNTLFVLNNGNPMYPKALYRVVVARMGTVSTLVKRSPHVLRHTFATTLLNNGADISSVKELLGHSSLASTQVYTHTTFDQLQQAYKQAHPHAKRETNT